MAEDFVYKFRTEGLDELTGKIRQMEAEFLASSKSSATLARALGLTFGEAQKLAQGIGLSAAQMQKAVGLLQQLGNSGASTQQRFDALNKGLGVTAQQFLALDKAVTTQTESQSRLKTQTEQAAIAQKSQAESNRQLAAAQRAQQAEAEKVFQTNARISQQRVKEELAAQALAARNLTAAQKAQQAEAEKVFQTNAKLAGQRVKDEVKAQADATKALAAAQRAQQVEAEKVFQANAKLTGQKVGEELERQKQGYQTLAVGSGAAVAGLLGLGKSALDAEVKLDSAQKKVATISRDSEGLTTALRGVSAELKNQASTTDLLAASYDILSSGFADNASATKITKQAVIGATAGFSDAATVGNALTSVLNAYKLSADDAASVTDKLVATQNAGKITVDEYARQIGKLAPLAAQAGVGLDELNGFVATATVSGVQSEAAFTGLRQGIAAVLKPSSDARKEAASLGIAFDAQALKTKGLSGILQELKEKSADTPEILLKLFGSVEAVTAIAPSAGAGFKKLQENIDASKNSAGEAQKAFDTVSGSLENQTKQTLNKLNEALTIVGSNIAPAIGSVVAGAGQLIDVFLKLPAPIQGALIATTGFIGVLSAAVLAIAAYNLANKTLALGAAGSALATIAETLATQGATAAKFLFTTQITLANVELAIFDARLALSTAATGGASAALGVLSTALLTVVAPLAALAAGVAIVGLVKLTEQIGDQNNTLEELRAATEQVLNAGFAAETKLKSAIDTRNESRRTGIALTQQQIDKEKEVLSQSAGALDLLKQQLADAEKVPKVQSNFLRETADLLTSGEIGLDGSIKKNDTAASQNNARDSNIDSLKRQIGAIESKREALEGATAAENANRKAGDSNKGDRKKESKDQGGDLRDDRQDAKAKEDAAFKNKERDAQQKFQDDDRRKEQSFNDRKTQQATKFQDAQAAIEKQNQGEKQQREEAFQNANAVIEKQNQTDKQQREFTFQNAQAEIEKQNQASKQQREAAFQQQQQQAEATFKEGQRQRDAALKSTQTEAGRQLEVEGARGRDKRKLLQQKQTQDNVAKLGESDLQGLTPEALAALAKRTAGVGSVRNKRDAEQAQIALQAITDRQNTALKEKERKEDEAFKAKQKADDLKFKVAQEAIDAKKETEKRERDRQFKVGQEAIDAKKEAEKRERDRQFKVAQEAIDAKKEIEKRERDRKFKSEQDGLDRQRETEKREAQRQFEAQQREVERGFKEEQRQKDRTNADEIKKIIESAKIKDSNTSPNKDVIPRFAGGGVTSGPTYAVNERGPELIKQEGNLQWVGDGRPGLFRFKRSGVIIPAHRTQATLNQLPQTPLSVAAPVSRGSFGGGSGSSSNNNDAVVAELVRLRSQVELMRGITQNYNIETKNPMDEVYRATKIAARMKR